MKYYVKNGDKIYGPVDEMKIRRKIADGFFSRECLVSIDRREWTRPASPVTSSRTQHAAANEAEAAKKPELIMPHLAAENLQPIPPNGMVLQMPKKRSRFPLKWILLILGLLVVVGVIVFLAVDIFLLDRQMISWLDDLF